MPYGKQWVSPEDIEEVSKVLKGDWLTTGPKIEEFEKSMNAFVGCKFSTSVSSGTAALELAVQSLELPKGAEVITTPLTFVADPNSILYNGLKPVFADIDPETYNIDPSEVERKITPKTKAILYVDYAGQPCEIDELREIAEKHDLKLIEDACHALGAEYKGKKIGNFADLTVLSFHPVKHITSGEGGMILTNNHILHDRLNMLRNHGIDRPTMDRFGSRASYAYDMKLLGRNYRLTDIQAALAISQLKRIGLFLEIRSRLASLYNKAFNGSELLSAPVVRSDRKHAWHIYVPLLNKDINRDDFFSFMRSKGIGVNVHYIPVYRHTYYRNNFRISENNFPKTQEIFDRIITLPLHPQMSKDDINRVAECVKLYER